MPFELQLRTKTARAAFVLKSYTFHASRLKVADFEPGGKRTPHVTLALKVSVFTPQLEKCSCAAENLRSSDQSHFARRRNESTSTRAIRTEGSRRGRDNFGATAKALLGRTRQHDDRCRGFAAIKRHSHGATARVPRRARSSQRFRHDQDTRRSCISIAVGTCLSQKRKKKKT